MVTVTTNASDNQLYKSKEKEDNKMSNPNETNEKCTCGCAEHSVDSAVADADQEDATVTLTMDDDSEVECAVIAIFPAADKEYIALLPLDEDGDNKDGEVFLYRYSDGDDDGEPTLENIEDDAEYEAAADAFDEILDEAEFDEEEE